jgi:hypothetical protein
MLLFFSFSFFSCPESRLSPISPVLISGLMKIINDTQGVSQILFFSRSIAFIIATFVFSFFQESKLRGSALVALGKLGQKLPEAVTKDMAIIQMLFNAMATVYKLIFFTQSTNFINTFVITGRTRDKNGRTRSSVHHAASI